MSPHPSVPLSAPAPARALERAAAHVRAGGLLILPTDTVYGIGALASDAAGVSRLFSRSFPLFAINFVYFYISNRFPS